MPDMTAEKSTSQLVAWRNLVDALDQLDLAWQDVQSTGRGAPGSAQLPGNIVVALALAAQHGTRTIAGIADVLVVQVDSGDAFQQVARELRHAIDQWPWRR